MDELLGKTIIGIDHGISTTQGGYGSSDEDGLYFHCAGGERFCWWTAYD